MKSLVQFIKESLDADNLFWKIDAWFFKEKDKGALIDFIRIYKDDKSKISYIDKSDIDYKGFIDFAYDNMGDEEIDYIAAFKQVLDNILSSKSQDNTIGLLLNKDNETVRTMKLYDVNSKPEETYYYFIKEITWADRYTNQRIVPYLKKDNKFFIIYKHEKDADDQLMNPHDLPDNVLNDITKYKYVLDTTEWDSKN